MAAEQKARLVKPGFRLSLTRRRSMMGYLFVLPFIIGLLIFFLVPIFQSFIFSIGRLEIGAGGYEWQSVGLANYERAFMIHPGFRRLLTEAVRDMVLNVPLIVIFSFFTANLLNQKFRGRALARLLIFLPVILATGIIASIEQNDMLLNMIKNADPEAAGDFIGAFELKQILMQTRIDQRFVGYITDAIDRIYEIISASGVQIMIFLAGLQTISPSLFEASNIEGATGWENFWKITFPMVSPLILVNAVYTIIDSFTSQNNGVMVIIRDTAFKNLSYGFSSAMAFSYFIIISILLLVVAAIISRAVFYQE
jgi:ABC-type sugar transport system permease subunit